MFYVPFLLLFLLGVDWVHDPHFGNSAFSSRMCSQPSCAHEDANQRTSGGERTAEVPTPLVGDFFTAAGIDIGLPVGRRLRVPIVSVLPLYQFMSLQR